MMQRILSLLLGLALLAGCGRELPASGGVQDPPAAAPEEVPRGAVVLIRAHGEPDGVYAALKARGCAVIDATCPNVTRIHGIVPRPRSGDACRW